MLVIEILVQEIINREGIFIRELRQRILLSLLVLVVNLFKAEVKTVEGTVASKE